MEDERKWPLAPPNVAIRSRPGDRPQWIDASADAIYFPAWRAAAARARLPVDAVLSLLVEWALITATPDLERARVLEAVRVDLSTPRLAPTARLRQWEQALVGRGPVPGGDELPEVCLPERLIARLGYPVRVARVVNLDDLPDALLVDRAATRAGLTPEVWALRAALRLGA